MKNWIFASVVVCFGLLTQACMLPIPPWEELERGETAKVNVCGDPGMISGTYLNAEAFAYQLKMAIDDFNANAHNQKGKPLFELGQIFPDAFYGSKAGNEVKGRCVFWIPTDRTYPTQAGNDKFSNRPKDALGWYDHEDGKKVFIFFPIDPCPGKVCDWQYLGSNVSDVVEHELGHAYSLPHPEEDSSGLLSPDASGIMSITHHTHSFTREGDLLNTCVNGADGCDPNFPSNSARRVVGDDEKPYSAVID